MSESAIAKNEIPLATSIPDGAVSLESILCTEELRRRPSRPPAYEDENRALVALTGALADSPRTILQTLAEKVLEVVQGDSAGLSLLTKDGKRFYWPAIAGAWKPHLGGGTPRDFGPCGDVLDRNVPLLFTHWERRYPYLRPATPFAEEGLLVPFYVNGKAVGTIWAIHHNDRRKFDAEDLRLLESLGRFASAAYQALTSIDDLKVQVAEREKAETALRELTDTLETRVRVRTEELEQEIAERKRAEDVARGAKARLEGILDIADDAIISVDSQQRILLFNQGAERAFGYVASEVIGKPLDLLIPPRFGAAHRKHIEAFAGSPDVARPMGQRREVCGCRKDGREFPAEASISKLNLGGELVFTVILRDITERKRAEQRLVAQHTVAQVLAEAATLEEATPRILQAVCECLAWDLGELWRVDRAAGVLRCVEVWHKESTEAREFAAASHDRTFMPGIGLPGRVWSSRETAYIPDLAQDCNFPRALLAAREGLHSAFGFPILLGGEVVGVMDFFSREIRQPDQDLLDMMATIGSQIGQFIERSRAEEALRAMEKHARSLVTVRADVGAELSKPGPTKEILRGCAEALVRHLDAAFVRVWTLESGAGVLELQASAGLYTRLDGSFSRMEVGALKVGRIAQEKKPHLTNDVFNDPQVWDKDWARSCGLVSFAGYPLIVDERVVGVMAMFARHPLPQATLDTLASVADAIAQGIERKRAEEEVRAAKGRFEGILEIAQDAIISVDSNHRIILFNHGAERVFGYMQAEVIGRPLDLLLPERFGDVHRRHIGEFGRSSDVARTMGQRREVAGRRKDGREFPAEASISKLNLGGELVFTVILRDITERKHADEALRRSEAYLVEAQRLSLTGSFGWRVSSGELFWSQETFRILGYGYDPIAKPTLELVLQRVHPEDSGLVQQTIDRASRDGAALDFEHRLRMPDGSVKHVHVVAHPVRDASGTLEFVGAVSDISAAKRAEERIRQDERELRQIVEAIPALILVLAPDGAPVYANGRVLEYTGLSLGNVLAGDFRERALHPSDMERLEDERRRALARGVPFELEQRVRRKDGEYRWFLTRFNSLRDEEGRVIRWYVTGTDIEDRKQAEERVQRENLALREEIDKTSMFEEIVGAAPALRAVLARVAKVAPTDSTVLVTGETGTGKELVARAIHKRSDRAARGFVSVNCAAVPPALITSDLFGHEKGAFTGALQRRIGRFELAEEGTLFLDEVGELPAETQIALLRVLQEREFERVGGTHPIRADVRVIAAANRDLQAAVAAGAFRSDLFYRLNVFPIEMPPLRDRQEDIPLLVEYFIDRYARKAGKKFRGIDKRTSDMLQSYAWPGNVRELQNVIERSVIVCETETFSVDQSWLSRETLPTQGPPPMLSRRPVTQERAMIEGALAATRGRVSGPSGAAVRLGVPPSTLESRIRSLKINKHRFKPV